MYKCRHFEIEELVPPEVYRTMGNRAWELMDDRLLMALDLLRDRYGAMTINNWKWNGNRQWSGLRTADSPYYSPFSQHTFGRAADCLFKTHTAESIQNAIQARFETDECFRHINSIELGVKWLHIDVRNCHRLKTFRP